MSSVINSAFDIRQRNLCLEVDCRDLTTVDREALHHVSVLARNVIRKLNEVLAGGRVFRCLELQTPLVVPAFDEPFVVEPLFEIKVQDLRIGGIRFYFSGVFCRTGHGNEQGRAESFGFELAIFLDHQVQRLLVSLSHRDDQQAAPP